MKWETIILEKGDISILTLNRPDRMNALNDRMFEEIYEALLEVEDGARVLIITGAGRAFCAGADLGPGGERILEEPLPPIKIREGFTEGPQKMIKKLYSFEKPTIAMINGACAGAGLGLALACDIRFSSDRAKFAHAFSRLGVIPGTGDIWFLPRICGLGKALEFIFTADVIDAEEALRIGLVNRVFPQDKLREETLKIAERIASNSPISLRLEKKLTYKFLNMELDSALDFIASIEPLCFLSGDLKEGMRAFREKREPEFKGE